MLLCSFPRYKKRIRDCTGPGYVRTTVSHCGYVNKSLKKQHPGVKLYRSNDDALTKACHGTRQRRVAKVKVVSTKTSGDSELTWDAFLQYVMIRVIVGLV